MNQRPPALEHIFVATDFSAGAAQAIARVGRLPLRDGGRVSILHVVPDERLENAARRELARLAAGLTKATSARGIRVSAELCRGQPYVEIIRRARSAGADLVVLGRHGRRPVKDMLFIGSTAERVIRMGEIPLLVVSRRGATNYRRPLVAVDLEDASRSVITLALRVLGPGVKAATIVHAYNVPFEGFITPSASPRDTTEMRKQYKQKASSDLAKLQASLGDVGVRWRTTLVRGDPRTAVLVQAVRSRTDLLAVGTHGRTGLSHALIGSVAEWLIRAATCDVLVARPTRVSFELP